ncbi:hypothetical protein DFS33DRAFT_999439 [Desarmillaria ectypa]|nr:hypothetical protein DFS33DRAFT_999439 [Desarmillaria ectypa]
MMLISGNAVFISLKISESTLLGAVYKQYFCLDAEPSISLLSLLLSASGSALYVVACAILFFRFCVYPYLPPMSPNALVQQLRGTVEDTIALLREYGRLLLVTDINIQLIRYILEIIVTEHSSILFVAWKRIRAHSNARSSTPIKGYL